MKHTRKRSYLRTASNLLIIGGMIILVKTFFFPIKEEIAFAFNSLRGVQYEVEAPRDTGRLREVLRNNRKEILVPADTQFGIVIPRIHANARVLPNIDTSDESVYLDALNRGVAHAAGTAFPGENGHIFLFAHSSDYFWNVQSYNAVFYLLYKLQKGDEISLFRNGKRFVYEMTGSTVVDPSEVEYLTRKTDSETLTLQTCWPPGTTLKRLLVFAEPRVE